MELMPSTAKELGVIDAYNPVENVLGGAKYLSNLINRYNGNITIIKIITPINMVVSISTVMMLPTKTISYFFFRYIFISSLYNYLWCRIS